MYNLVRLIGIASKEKLDDGGSNQLWNAYLVIQGNMLSTIKCGLVQLKWLQKGQESRKMNSLSCVPLDMTGLRVVLNKKGQKKEIGAYRGCNTDTL